ncbi:hypothetical protein HID58_043159 [Brassica napus]|uniref:Uncharacterized protein n=1 Tax=Brassica napus TaxID=3708 RepID=A0ABQ8BFR6_BRANA|nr:hypothetical protein HID58_043159 [Brassica napus]
MEILLTRKRKLQVKKSKAKPKEMTKNINSVSITVLFFVLLVASTEILKSEAQTFCFECGPVPFLGTNADCFNVAKPNTEVLQSLVALLREVRNTVIAIVDP